MAEPSIQPKAFTSKPEFLSSMISLSKHILSSLSYLEGVDFSYSDCSPAVSLTRSNTSSLRAALRRFGEDSGDAGHRGNASDHPSMSANKGTGLASSCRRSSHHQLSSAGAPDWPPCPKGSFSPVLRKNSEEHRQKLLTTHIELAGNISTFYVHCVWS